MGWWSKGILSGDTPLDALFNLDAYILPELMRTGTVSHNFTTPPPEHFERLDMETVYQYRRSLQSIMGCIVHDTELEFKENKHLQDYCISMQVLGAISMACGAYIPEVIKNRIIAACEKDPWSKRDIDRRLNTADLAEKLREHRAGQITIVRSDNLGVALRKAIDAERSGRSRPH